MNSDLNLVPTGWRALPPAAATLFGVALVLGFIAYLPFLALPPLPDDYLQAELAARYGPISAWGDLLADPLYRCRSTSLLITHWTLQSFGFSIVALNTSSLLLHLLNVTLVFLLGSINWVGWRTSGLAAIAFAVGERHHEAIIWYAAMPELLVFFFTLLAVLLWTVWVDSETPKPVLWWCCFACFMLALVSKESGVVACALMAITSFSGKRGAARSASALAPFGMIALAYTLASVLGKSENQHYSDGTFSFSAPFLATAAVSLWRGLWFWGIVALGVVAFSARSKRFLAIRPLAWMFVSLLPYSFLTYMPRIPSRHHYLAAAGFALIVGLGGGLLWDSGRNRRMVAGLLGLFVLHNTAYLWFVKVPQFSDRARPIESVLTFMRNEPHRPVALQCFPDKIEEAQRAVVIRLSGVAADITAADGAPRDSIPYCYK